VRTELPQLSASHASSGNLLTSPELSGRTGPDDDRMLNRRLQPVPAGGMTDEYELRICKYLATAYSGRPLIVISRSCNGHNKMS